jgi:hypothetical protein
MSPFQYSEYEHEAFSSAKQKKSLYRGKFEILKFRPDFHQKTNPALEHI